VRHNIGLREATVWTGLDGLIGAGIALGTHGRTILGEDATPRMLFGIVWGSILPDIDPLVSTAIIAAGGAMQQALAPHRTLTHSLFVILALALMGLALWRIGWSARVGGDQEVSAYSPHFRMCMNV
jgi:membrane-bound metal-dependent hydrolase YbcI (DUF457 family)